MEQIKIMNKHFTSILDMVGRICTRKCDNEKFIFFLPVDETCKEFILFNLNEFNNHKGVFLDKSVMFPTIIKEENFADVFKVNMQDVKADVQCDDLIDTTSAEWKILTILDKLAFKNENEK
mgnify:CR=1 FL=1